MTEPLDLDAMRVQARDAGEGWYADILGLCDELAAARARITELETAVDGVRALCESELDINIRQAVLIIVGAPPTT